jgi:hypothetical protein
MRTEQEAVYVNREVVVRVGRITKTHSSLLLLFSFASLRLCVRFFFFLT